MVVSQLTILLWPDFQKTLAMLNLKTSCSKLNGKSSRRSSNPSTELRKGWRDIWLAMVEIMTKSPSALGWIWGRGKGETDDEALAEQAAQGQRRVEYRVLGQGGLDGRLQGLPLGQGGAERERSGF